MLFHFTNNPRSPLISWSKTMAVVDMPDYKQARQAVIKLFGIDPDASMCLSCGPNLLVRELKERPDIDGWAGPSSYESDGLGVALYMRGHRSLYLISGC